MEIVDLLAKFLQTERLPVPDFADPQVSHSGLTAKLMTASYPYCPSCGLRPPPAIKTRATDMYQSASLVQFWNKMVQSQALTMLDRVREQHQKVLEEMGYV